MLIKCNALLLALAGVVAVGSALGIYKKEVTGNKQPKIKCGLCITFYTIMKENMRLFQTPQQQTQSNE